MRLTLRTLLAWLDGVLPATEQDELAAKVASSPIAPKLVDRIRAAMARPGLVAPRPDGRGLADDPNTIAEFLDNVLPAERLETFERVCIDSDMHLAEAADCHATLAELARDPAAVMPLDRRLRKRLLEEVARGGRGEEPVEPQQRPHEDSAATVAALKDAIAANRSVTRGVAAGQPAGRRGASWAAWLSAGVALLLLVGLVGLLARSLLVSPTRGREVAAARQREIPPAVGPAAPVPEAPPAPAGSAVEESAVAPADREGAPMPPAPDVPAAAAAPSSPPATNPAALPVAAVPGVEPPEVPAPPQPNPPPTLPLPVMELAEPEPAGPADEVAPPGAAPPAAGVPPGAVAEGGVVLHRVGEDRAARWETLVGGDPLEPVEEFAVPAHSFPRVTRTKGELSIRLHPGTLAALVTDADGTPRLEVVFGRAVAWTEAAESKLGITAGGLSGVVSLGKGKPLGIAVDLLREPGTDPTVVPPGRTVLLHATGGIAWRQTEVDGGPPGRPLEGIDLEHDLPPRSELVWTSAEPGAARVAPVGRSPDWMGRQVAEARLDQRAGAEVASRLAAADRDAAEETLAAMTDDRQPEHRMAAAATLALLGDYEPAVALLCDDSAERRLRDGQWTTLEAATIQQALARGANAAAKLREAFAARGPAGRADELFLLARGLSAGEREAGGALALVDALAAEQPLVVRRYAFKNLVAEFPDDPAGRIEYMPDRTAALNAKGIEWWRRKVTAAAPAAAP